MKRRMLRVLAFSPIVIGLAGIVALMPSVERLENVVHARTETTIVFDVATDCATFNYSRGIPLAQIVRGDAFIFNGKIFPGGSLSGVSGNNPNGPGSIGTWVGRGQSTATLAEHLANPSSPGVFSTQYFLLNDGRALTSEGWFAPAGFGRSAVTGGMGALRGAAGETSEAVIGTNSTGCANVRVTITLDKQAPK